MVAPAGKVVPNELEVAIHILEQRGYRVQLSTNLFNTDQPYLSATDGCRLSDLQSALSAREVKAVFCARGGYGVTRIVDAIRWDEFLHSPKWVIGFSDITALHLSLFAHGVKSVHGSMPKLFSRDEKATLESLFACIEEGSFKIEAGPCEWNRTGMAEGRMIGGNLSLITDSIGTDSEPDLTGNILVLEEVGEPYYKIDRMLTHLRRTGLLKRISGVAVGHISGEGIDKSFSESVEAIFLNACSDSKIPIAFGLPTGHEQPNCAWIHGGRVRMEVNENGSFLHSLER
jgi:muramoyltetrapeptide carboxypeptidase